MNQEEAQVKCITKMLYGDDAQDMPNFGLRGLLTDKEWAELCAALLECDDDVDE